MKFGTILKLLLGTGILGLITFNILNTGIIFWICLVIFVIITIFSGVVVYLEIDEILG